MRTVIVGFGNEILGDDGIGIYLGEEIAGELNLDFVRCSMYGLEILNRLTGYSKVFIIDSVVQEDCAVGMVKKFTMDNFENCRHMSSPHTTDFATGIKFGRESGLELPGEIFIYGVTVKNVKDFSDTLSGELKNKYTGIKNKIMKNIKTKLN